MSASLFVRRRRGGPATGAARPPCRLCAPCGRTQPKDVKRARYLRCAVCARVPSSRRRRASCPVEADAPPHRSGSHRASAKRVPRRRGSDAESPPVAAGIFKITVRSPPRTEMDAIGVALRDLGLGEPARHLLAPAFRLRRSPSPVRSRLGGRPSGGAEFVWPRPRSSPSASRRLAEYVSQKIPGFRVVLQGTGKV